MSIIRLREFDVLYEIKCLEFCCHFEILLSDRKFFENKIIPLYNTSG